jgi:7-keto-8-aminopelargonate synthetase-like enzyme
MRLASQYRWRVMLDDSLAFGVLGSSTGRGSVEHFALPEESTPQVIVGALSTTLGSVGGFCVGSREVVDHQRLSGAGYCFSASAPPYLCASAAAALAALRAAPERVGQLGLRAMSLHDALERAFAGGPLAVVSHKLSPIKHLRLVAARSPVAAAEAARSGGGGGGGGGNPPLQGARGARMLSPTTQKLSAQDLAFAQALEKEEAILDALVRAACGKGVLIARSHGLPGEVFPERPSLKVAATLRHTDADCAALVVALKAAAEEAFS